MANAVNRMDSPFPIKRKKKSHRVNCNSCGNAEDFAFDTKSPIEEWRRVAQTKGWSILITENEDQIYCCNKGKCEPSDGAKFHQERTEILADARRAMVDRHAEYGEVRENFESISRLWAAYLGHPVSPADVAAMMILFKTSRLKANPENRDSWVDVVGYAALGGEIALKKGG